MKKTIVLIIAAIFALCFAVGCQKSENETQQDTPQTIEEESTATSMTEAEEESQPEEDSKEAIDYELIEYLSLLGLDEACSYQLGGTFPSGIEDKEMYLVSVTDITEQDFADIEAALQSNGFTVVSDISTNEEAKARSYPYSNNESVYIEIVFSYEAAYIDVTFTPTS